MKQAALFVKMFLVVVIGVSQMAEAQMDLNRPLSGSGEISILKPIIFKAVQTDDPESGYMEFQFGSCEATISYDEVDQAFMESQGHYPALTFRDNSFNLSTAKIQRQKSLVTEVTFNLNSLGPLTAGALTQRWDTRRRRGSQVSRVYTLTCRGSDLRLQDLINAFNGSIEIESWSN